MAKHKPRVFSGVQPTGNLHLGNYLGAITKFVALQEEFECIYCVVDMHAITVWQDPKELVHNTREVTAAFLTLIEREGEDWLEHASKFDIEKFLREI